MKLRRNDRDEVGMMILVILNTFPSFLSSQMFGKNVVFLDFIPIIPASFRHSGVIPKFHFNWNDAGMTNDFGLKLTTFPERGFNSSCALESLSRGTSQVATEILLISSPDIFLFLNFHV